MPSIMPVNPLFVYSNGDSSESTTTNKSVEAKLAFEKYATTFGVKIQKYHSDNDALNTLIIALVLNIKTGYISSQLQIVFNDDSQQHPRG